MNNETDDWDGNPDSVWDYELINLDPKNFHSLLVSLADCYGIPVYGDKGPIIQLSPNCNPYYNH